MSTYDAGKLSTRVVLSHPSDTTDSLGQPVATWTTYATVWANITRPNGIASIMADKDTGVSRASIRLRQNNAVQHRDRVTVGNIHYIVVRPPIPTDDKRFTDLVCEQLA